MAEYEYKGPHPVVDDAGELVHPGDVREFGADPGWGLWELMPGGERQSAAGQAPVSAGASDGQSSLTPPEGTEGGM